MRIVGRGAFGKVRIVEHRESCQLYALKYINKSECIRMDAVRNIIRERTFLEQLDHPFLCRLRFAFQDSSHMYMVTDLMLGGDLHYHISRQTFSENILRFWFAELAAATKYLHLNNVVHRDIKPENILMDNTGHVHLTDFNVASYIQPNRPLMSSSGTEYYMAPEVFKGQGYNESVDWWSLGVTLYECVFGKRPFEYETTDELRAAIRRGYIHYPTDIRSVSGECLAVIQGFLEQNPTRRLGQGDEGWTGLVHHPFFRSIDWRRLESKTIPPPFTPAANQNNFDLTHDLEELLLQEGSLSGQQRQGRARVKQLDQEKQERDLQLIAEKFKPFDFTVFEKYEGFKDPIKMTVGDPPDWVKPAFQGAEQGDLLPVKRITTDHWYSADDTVITTTSTSSMAPDVSWRSPVRSVSLRNMDSLHSIDLVWERRALATQRDAKPGAAAAAAADAASEGTTSTSITDGEGSRAPTIVGTSLTGQNTLCEEYAMSLQGIQKKQSTRSFRERRERDKKSINNVLLKTSNGDA